MERDLINQLGILAAHVLATPRDWQGMQQRSYELHLKNADDWAGEQIKNQIDPGFSLANAVTRLQK